MADSAPEAPAKGVLAEAVESGNFSRIELAKGLSASAKMLCGVLFRQQCDDVVEEKAVEAGLVSIPDDGGADVALRTLREVVDGIHSGADLSAQYPVLNRLLHNQEQRAELIDSLLLTSEYKRVIDVVGARNHLESQLVKSAYRDDLTPAEQLVLLSQLAQIARASESKIKAGSIPVSDIAVLLKKVDFAANEDSESLKKMAAKSSPQGREVIRKLAMRLFKVVRETTVPEAETTELP